MNKSSGRAVYQDMHGWDKDDDMDLIGTHCPRCDAFVLHESDRPSRLWHIPSMINGGEHLVRGADGILKPPACPGFKPEKFNRPWWVPFLRWLIS